MYLEKLEIQGFKSFANKNRLLFPGLKDGIYGITGIVGPNGSGKSNIADAVRWALGEQSIKTLRGKKSEDVIFSGSDQKSRLGMAEVSLFLNNEQPLKSRRVSALVQSEINNDNEGAGKNDNQSVGFKAIGDEKIADSFLDASEVVITRRIFRDGESEYLINNKKVRLADIQMLLAKASFGQKTYSVIGQGMVENFLNTSPAERKDFFDEATGVKQFQIKRDLSLNKLEGSYENLAQAEMLLSEIEPRMKSLTRQVDKLKRRDETETALNDWQYKYYGQLWHEINNKFREFNDRFLELEKTKFSKEDRLSEVMSDLEKIENQPKVNDEFNDLRERADVLRRDRDNLNRQLFRINSWRDLRLEDPRREDPKLLEEQKVKLDEQRQKNGLEIDRLRGELAELADISQGQRDLNGFRQERDSAAKEISRLDAWLEMKLESQGKFDLSFLNNKQSELAQELARTKEEIISTENETSANIDELGRLNQQKISLSEKISRVNEALRSLNARGGNHDLKEINSRLRQSLEKLDGAETQADLESLKKYLREIREEIRAILKISAGEQDHEEIERATKDLDQFSEEKENLLSLIQEKSLSIKSAEHQLNFLKDKNNRLDAELNSVVNKLGQAQEKIDASEIEEKKSAWLKIVSERDEQIKNLSEKINQANSSRQSLQEQLLFNQSEFQSLQSEISHLEQKLVDLKINSAKYEARLEDLETTILKYNIVGFSEVKSELLDKEEELSKTKVESFETELQGVTQKIEQFNSEQESRRNQLLNLQKNIQTLHHEINGLNSELNDLKVGSARQETRLEDLETEIRDLQLDLQKIKNGEISEEIDFDRAKEEISRLRRQLEMIGGIDPEIEKEYESTKERHDFLFSQTSDLHNAIGSLEKIIIELDVNIKERFDGEFQVISEKFSEYFKILFSGGNAKIFKIMEGENNGEENSATAEEEKDNVARADDNLKKIKYLRKHNAVGLAGIEIEATPPGKKIKSIAMLSGGERALTAIALICAIISANPAPFVVLDEVDAALDEANSERLAKILDDLSSKTQFIVITHNRASMRRSEVLYGVTMQADGISQLLSVKLEEVKSAR